MFSYSFFWVTNHMFDIWGESIKQQGNMYFIVCTLPYQIIQWLLMLIQTKFITTATNISKSFPSLLNTHSFPDVQLVRSTFPTPLFTQNTRGELTNMYTHIPPYNYAPMYTVRNNLNKKGFNLYLRQETLPVTNLRNVQPPWLSWLGMWSHHLHSMHSRKFLTSSCHADLGLTALSVTLDGFRSLKTHSLYAGGFQPVLLDTCMEVCAAHESVNIANYCAENHRHLGEI